MPHEKGSSQPPCNPNYHAGYLQQEEGYHAFLPILSQPTECAMQPSPLVVTSRKNGLSEKRI